jgi:hypothetical protein
LKDADPVSKMAMKIRQNNRKDRMRQLQKKLQGKEQSATREPLPLPKRESHQRQPASRQQQSLPPRQALSKQSHLPPTQPQQTQPKHVRPDSQSQKKKPPPQQQETMQPPSQARPDSRPPLPLSRKSVSGKDKPKIPAAKNSLLVPINSKRKPKTVPVVGQDDAADSGLLFNTATSLAAFESLANETSDNWSKIARATGMMEHEVEAEILDTLANKMNRPPSSTANKDGANVGTSQQPPSSASPNRAGTKRRAITLPSTRTSKRLAATAATTQPTKDLPTKRSLLLQRTRSASKHQQEAGPSTNDHIPGVGSPDVNSALFAGGTDTLDAWNFQEDGTRRTSFGLERDPR